MLKVTVSCTRASEKKILPPSMGDSFRLSLSIYEKLHLEEASLVHARTINNIPHNIYGIQAKFQKE